MNLSLIQEGNTSILKVKEVVNTSILHNLVLLETEQNVTNYLTLADALPNPDDNLSWITYPIGVFTKIK